MAHGAGLAAVFPAWMKYVWSHDIPRFARFATEVWGVEADWEHPERAALEGIRRMEAFFAASGLPVTLAELGIPRDRIAEMAEKAVAKGGGTVGNFVKLSSSDVERILELASS